MIWSFDIRSRAFSALCSNLKLSLRITEAMQEEFMP